MNNIIITGKMHPGFDKILTEDAQEFLVKLHQRFNNTLKAVLDRRTSTTPTNTSQSDTLQEKFNNLVIIGCLDIFSGDCVSPIISKKGGPL